MAEGYAFLCSEDSLDVGKVGGSAVLMGGIGTPCWPSSLASHVGQAALAHRSLSPCRPWPWLTQPAACLHAILPEPMAHCSLCAAADPGHG